MVWYDTVFMISGEILYDTYDMVYDMIRYASNRCKYRKIEVSHAAYKDEFRRSPRSHSQRFLIHRLNCTFFAKIYLADGGRHGFSTIVHCCSQITSNINTAVPTI